MPVTINSIVLPPDTEWSDEWNYSAVKQTVTVTLGGNQVIEEAAQQKGRPITLLAEWIDIAELSALEKERDTPNNTMLLTVADGRIFEVRFKQGKSALKVTPILPRPDYDPGDYFDVKISLFEV